MLSQNPTNNPRISRSLILVVGTRHSIPPMRLSNIVSALTCVSLAAAWTTFVLPHSSGGDDTPGINAAFAANKALAKDATIVFQKGVTYNILTPLTFPQFQNVLVSIQGNITYAADITATQGRSS